MHIDLCCWKRSDQGSQSGRQVSKFCFCFSMNLNFFFLCELKENYLTVLNYSIVLYLVACVWLFATPCTVAFQAPLSMGILQARILEWVAMPSSRESSQPRDLTHVSHITGRFFTIWATLEASDVTYSVSNQHLPTKITRYWEDTIKLFPGRYMKVTNKKRKKWRMEARQKEARKEIQYETFNWT